MQRRSVAAVLAGLLLAATLPGAAAAEEPPHHDPAAAQPAEEPPHHDPAATRAAHPTHPACEDPPPAPFTDRAEAGVHTHAVDCIAHWSIAAGQHDGRFLPDARVTRAQMATFTLQLLLSAAAELPPPGQRFADLDGNVHRRAIERLAAAGIIAGTAPDSFDPDAEVTRAQSASMLVAAAAHAGHPLPEPPEPTLRTDDTTPTTFPDLASGPHLPNVMAAAHAGVITGHRDGTFRPDEPITRAQMAAMLARTLDHLVDAGVPPLAAANSVDDDLLREELCLRNDPEDDLARAQGILEGRYGFNPHRTVTVDPLDWAADPLGQINWQFQFHTLRWLLPLLHASEYTGDPRYRDHAFAVAREWIDNNPFDAPPSPFSWNDHSTAWRLKTFTCLSLQADSDPTTTTATTTATTTTSTTNDATTTPTPTWLHDSIVEHRDRLADPGFYVHYGNHALNQDLGMLAAACHTHHWDGRDLAIERIGVLAEASIEPHGVNDEQSVEYQDFNYYRYRAATRLLTACGRTQEPWQQRLPRMVDVLIHMTQPDGTYAPLGDTDRRAPRFADHDPRMRWLTSGGAQGTPPAPEDTFASFDAGYTFSRSGWGTQRPLHQETYLALRHGPARALHGHFDHGSILLYADGQPLITHPGKYAYGATAMRAHVRTAEAHSRITLDDCRPQGNRTEVVEIGHTAHLDRVVLDVDVCDGARWLRTVVFLRESGALVVLDELEADTRATQRWQLEPGADTTVHSPQLLTASWPSGARLTLEQLLPAGETTVVTGGTDPLRGWVSEAYAEVTRAPNVAITADQTPRRDLLTVLRPATTAGDIRTVLREEPDAYHLQVTVGGDATFPIAVPRQLPTP